MIKWLLGILFRLLLTFLGWKLFLTSAILLNQLVQCVEVVEDVNSATPVQVSRLQ